MILNANLALRKLLLTLVYVCDVCCKNKIYRKPTHLSLIMKPTKSSKKHSRTTICGNPAYRAKGNVENFWQSFWMKCPRAFSEITEQRPEIKNIFVTRKLTERTQANSWIKSLWRNFKKLETLEQCLST